MIMNCFGQNGNRLFFSSCIELGGEDITVLEKVAEGNKANPGLKKMSLEDSSKNL